MTGKTHVAIGIAAGLTISFGQRVENQLILVLASALGSLIPDLDHPKA
ncbi:MAG: metal-dependent hydrolase, partial [Tissierellia bacterium]|nr:metal-dependent hydrolase [Tissierellia bacterium]